MSKKKRRDVIYVPDGRAGEYADWASNLYWGCEHRCRYCYAASVLRVPEDKLWDFNYNPHPKGRILERLDRAAAKMAREDTSSQVLLSFVCDDYQPIDAETGITREAIKILHKHGHSVCILTKGGTRALRDIDLFTPEDAFACTLTCLEVKDSLRWEPGAATPQDRLIALRAFHEEGIPTWVSLEPVIHPRWTLRLIEITHEDVDRFKVGRMNYINRLPEDLAAEVRGIDWGEFGRKAEALLCKLNKRYMLKDDLKRMMRGRGN